MSKGQYEYVVTSEYGGEQGHQAGGDYREHFVSRLGAGICFEYIDKNPREFDYRDIKVVIRKIK